MPTIDLHTHTYRCHHASGDVSEYAAQALHKGIEILGISDHVPLPNDLWPLVRMPMDQIRDYFDAVLMARGQYPQIRILKAFECEYLPEIKSYYQNELLDSWHCDYLILGTHYIRVSGWQSVYGGVNNAQELAAYTDILVQGMASGLFTFVAHPDLFGNSYPKWDDECRACSREILQAAQDLQIPLEINGYGYRKGKKQFDLVKRFMYPWRPFWEMAVDYDVQVIVNSDAHRPQDVGASFDLGEKLIQDLNLQKWDAKSYFSPKIFI